MVLIAENNTESWYAVSALSLRKLVTDDEQINKGVIGEGIRLPGGLT